MCTNSQRTVLPPFHRCGRRNSVREKTDPRSHGGCRKSGASNVVHGPFLQAPQVSARGWHTTHPPLPEPLPASGRARGQILDKYPGPPQDIPPEPPQLAQLLHQSSRSQTDSTAGERSPEPAPLRRLRPESPPLAGPRSAGLAALAQPLPRLGDRATSSSGAGGVASSLSSNCVPVSISRHRP